MINQITLQNFKSFAQPVSANLEDLLVIAGPNSGGKTTIIQALLLLAQTLSSPKLDVALDLGGDYVQFAEFRDCVFGRPKNINANFSIGFHIATNESDQLQAIKYRVERDSRWLEFITDSRLSRGIHLPEDMQISRKAELEITFGATQTGKPLIQALRLERELTDTLTVKQIIEKSGKSYRVTRRLIAKNLLNDNILEEISEIIKRIHSLAEQLSSETSSRQRTIKVDAFLRAILRFYGINWSKPPEALISIKRELESVPRLRVWSKQILFENIRLSEKIINVVSQEESENSILLPLGFDHFFPNTALYLREFDPKMEEFAFSFRSIFGNSIQSLRQYLRNFEYVGPLRAKPERVYLPTGTPPDIGKSGENAVPILWLEQNEKIFSKTRPGQNPTKKRLGQAVQEWFEEFGIAQSFHVIKPKRVIYQAELDGPPNSGTKVTIADVGFGVSQLLPVIVAGLRAPRNSTLIFEQPEIHLHPRLQAKLADFFICLVELDKKVIVETHSEHLINMLRLRIVQDNSGSLQNRIGILFIQGSDPKGEIKGSRIENLEIDKYGQVVNWPINFFSEYGDLNEQILKAMMSRYSSGE